MSSSKGLAILADALLTAVAAGVERSAVVDKVREMENAGATPDQITDAIAAMRKASEDAAQQKIDAARGAG